MKRVLFIPYNEANEYQNLLTNALESENIDVIEGKFGSSNPDFFPDFVPELFPLLSYVINEDLDAIHLIWTHPFFLMSDLYDSTIISALASLFKSAVFLTNVTFARLSGVTIVWTVHNKLNHEREHPYIDLFTSRVLARLCSHITVECQRARQIISDAFWLTDNNKIFVIPEGNYINAYPNETTKNEAREWIGINKDTFLFVYFGLIREYKGVLKLIGAFEDIELSDTKLLIVGNPWTDALHRKVEKRCNSTDDVEHILEYVPNDEIQYYMTAADTVALPYRDIMTSGSVLLAMSFGRPVVTPDLGCIPALLPEEGGFSYDSQAPKGLHRGLKQARFADELSVRGEANFARAQSLSWDDIGKKTSALY